MAAQVLEWPFGPTESYFFLREKDEQIVEFWHLGPITKMTRPSNATMNSGCLQLWHISSLVTSAHSQMCREGGTANLSDTFSVRKMQLLGGQRPPQVPLASPRLAYGPRGGLWPPKRSWGGLRLPKSCIFLRKMYLISHAKSAVRGVDIEVLVSDVHAVVICSKLHFPDGKCLW